MINWSALHSRLPFIKSKPRVAVVRLRGTIGRGRLSLNDETLEPILEKAFSRGKPNAVALLINSPGGSPVQSSLIASRIRRLADEKNVPVHAFVEDVAASGGYWLAASADDIWVDFGSIIGSIGVISASFGLPVLLARQGIERRVHTSGRSKSTLDPFLPQKEEDVERLKHILEDLHSGFIAYVKERRGAALADDPALFTGEFWLGRRAVKLGLVDGEAHMMPKLRQLYGKDVRLIRYGAKKGLLSRFGATMAEDAVAAVEARAQYAQFGL
ncbi:MAG TPA: S49 family peptidase [Roseovarius sp.]